MKRGGGRRYYRPDDIDLLRGIRHLLYGEGYTIRGVQRLLREQGVSFVQTVWQEGAPQPERDAADTQDDGAAAERGGLLGRLPGFFRGGEGDEQTPRARREPTLTIQSVDDAPPADPGAPAAAEAGEPVAPVPPTALSREH